jgi:ribonucleoside-diphosphate reductase subunit M2
MFQDHQAMFWTKAVVKPANDLKDWEAMDDNSRKFIMNILGFFAGSDRIVMENLKERLIPEIKIYEAELFMAFQMGMEAIHTEVYGLLIDVLVKDPKERNRLIYATHEIPSVSDKANWAKKWTKDLGAPLSERLLAYIIVEGLFFSASFCSIHWLKSQGKMLDGLCKSNDLISRDENLHVKFNILLYQIITSKENLRLSYERVCEILQEAVDIETRFVKESLPWKLPNMNSQLMSKYVNFVANSILTRLGYSEFYTDTYLPTYMITQGMQTKGNFFETETTNYQQANVKASESDKVFVSNGDF